MKLRCNTCNGENEVDLSKENICTICLNLINLDSEQIKDQFETRNLSHLIKTTAPARKVVWDKKRQKGKVKQYIKTIFIWARTNWLLILIALFAYNAMVEASEARSYAKDAAYYAEEAANNAEYAASYAEEAADDAAFIRRWSY